jgi:hypothetical protein
MTDDSTTANDSMPFSTSGAETSTTSTADLLAEWNSRLSGALGIPPADIGAILEMTGVVAHNVVRPAAPLSAFLVGYATAMNSLNGEPQAFDDAIAVASRLASPPTDS